MENDKNIPVVILCGGMGTRLREERSIPNLAVNGNFCSWDYS